MGGPHIIRPLYGKNNDGLNLVFNFKFTKQPFSAEKFENVIQETENILPAPYWPCYVLSNHDEQRMITRYGNDEKKAKLLMLLLLTLRGTPFIYYGEEIGMHQVKIPRELLKDPITNLKVWRIPIGRFFGRDGCRTPMQWTSSTRNAGFSSNPNIEPWLPISEDSTTINVETQENDQKSMLTFLKNLIQLRKRKYVLTEGDLELLPLCNNKCLVYERLANQEGVLVILNFHNKVNQIDNPHPSSTAIFSTDDFKISLETENFIQLRPFEGLVTKFA